MFFRWGLVNSLYIVIVSGDMSNTSTAQVEVFSDLYYLHCITIFENLPSYGDFVIINKDKIYIRDILEVIVDGQFEHH